MKPNDDEHIVSRYQGVLTTMSDTFGWNTNDNATIVVTGLILVAQAITDLAITAGEVVDAINSFPTPEK